MKQIILIIAIISSFSALASDCNVFVDMRHSSDNTLLAEKTLEKMGFNLVDSESEADYSFYARTGCHLLTNEGSEGGCDAKTHFVPIESNEDFGTYKISNFFTIFFGLTYDEFKAEQSKQLLRALADQPTCNDLKKQRIKI